MRLPLPTTITTRDGTQLKDSYTANCMVSQKDVRKRFGLVPFATVPAGFGQGMFDLLAVDYVISSDRLYSEAGTNYPYTAPATPGKLYQSVNSTVSNLVLFKTDFAGYTFDGTTVKQIPIANSVASVTIINAGTGGTPGTYALTFTGGSGTLAAGTYTIGAGGTITSITMTVNGTGYGTTPPTVSFPLGAIAGAVGQVNISAYPAQTVPGVVFLDGTYYVMDLKGNICGSNLNDPLTFPPLNVIVANSLPGAGRALVRQLNYVLALKEASTEVFYDAGAPPPGSPLQAVQNAMSKIGCADGRSIAVVDNALLFTSQSLQKGIQVVMVQGEGAPQPVSDADVDRVLNQVGAFTANVYAYGVKIQGHSCYVLTLVQANITLVYDLQSKAWGYWTTSVPGTAASVTTLTSNGGVVTGTVTPYLSLIGTVPTDVGPLTLAVDPSTKNVYVNCTSVGVIDNFSIQNQLQPVRAATNIINYNGYGLTLLTSYLVFACQNLNSLMLLDRTTLAITPTVSFSLGGPETIVSFNNYVIVPNWPNTTTITIYNLVYATNWNWLAVGTIASACNTGNSGNNGLTVDSVNALLYVANGAILSCWVISSVITPTLRWTVTLGANITAVCVSGNNVAVSTATTVSVYVGPTPVPTSTPVLVGAITGLAGLNCLSILNGYIIAGGTATTLITMPGVPTVAFTYAITLGTFVVANGFVYALSGGNLLYTYQFNTNVIPLQGGYVTISGALQSGYNGTFFATPSGNSFTYNINGTAVSPATGTILVNSYTENYLPYTSYLNDLIADFLLHESTGMVLRADTTVYQDNLQPIQVHVRTQLWDGGTTGRKYLEKIELVGDKVLSTAQLRYTDNDYQTYSNFQPIYLGDEHTMLAQVGSTRRRAFDLLHVDNTPFRAEGLEIEGDMGKSSVG